MRCQTLMWATTAARLAPRPADAMAASLVPPCTRVLELVLLLSVLCAFVRAEWPEGASEGLPVGVGVRITVNRGLGSPYLHELTCANRERLEPELTLTLVQPSGAPASAVVQLVSSQWTFQARGGTSSVPRAQQGGTLCIQQVDVTIEPLGRNETTDLLDMDPDPSWYPLAPPAHASEGSTASRQQQNRGRRRQLEGDCSTESPCGSLRQLQKGVPPHTGLSQASVSGQPCPGWRVERFNDSARGTGLTLSPTPAGSGGTDSDQGRRIGVRIDTSVLGHLQSCLRRVFFALSLNADLQAGQVQPGPRTVRWTLHTLATGTEATFTALSHVAVTPPPVEPRGCRDSPYGYMLQGGPAPVILAPVSTQQQEEEEAEEGWREPHMLWPELRILPPPVGSDPDRDPYQLPNITSARITLTPVDGASSAAALHSLGVHAGMIRHAGETGWEADVCPPLLLAKETVATGSSLAIWGYAPSDIYESCLRRVFVGRQGAPPVHGLERSRMAASLAIQSEAVTGLASAAGIGRVVAV